MSEARTQDYVAGVVNAVPDTAVRVPRIHLAFMYEGRGYIVMEYVAGVTVQQLLQKLNATRVERNRICIAVAAAVKAAHRDPRLCRYPRQDLSVGDLSCTLASTTTGLMSSTTQWALSRPILIMCVLIVFYQTFANIFR